MKGMKRLAIAMAHLLAASGCATAPTMYPVLPPAAPGHQVIRISAATWVESIPDFPGMARSQSMKSLSGVRCTARNAKGSWEVTTPGTLEVAIGEGAGPLAIDCDMEGYRHEHADLSCVTPRSRSTTTGLMTGIQLIGVAGPAAIFMAPAVVIAALVGAGAAGAAVGSAAAGPDPDVCNYTERGIVVIWMMRN